MHDEEIQAVRKVRHEISAEFGHDVHKLLAHYRAMEEEMRRSGEFRFVDAPKGNARQADATRPPSGSEISCSTAAGAMETG